MQRRPHTSPAFGEERGQEEGYRVTHEAMKEPPDSGRSTYRSVGGLMDIGHESLDQLEKEYNSGIDIHADHTAGQVFQQIVDDHHHFIRSDHGSDDTSDELLSGPSTDQVMKQPHVTNVLPYSSVRSMRIMASWFLSSAEASRIKKEYNDANSKLSKLRSRISSLTEKLKHDFGKYTT
ncbi:hypothetical protein BHE74_00052672 [Ensete ventricosum]|nr:hypothetical protein BHE74_00052672 [Ensete ventricosum]